MKKNFDFHARVKRVLTFKPKIRKLPFFNIFAVISFVFFLVYSKPKFFDNSMDIYLK